MTSIWPKIWDKRLGICQLLQFLRTLCSVVDWLTLRWKLPSCWKWCKPWRHHTTFMLRNRMTLCKAHIIIIRILKAELRWATCRKPIDRLSCRGKNFSEVQWFWTSLRFRCFPPPSWTSLWCFPQMISNNFQFCLISKFLALCIDLDALCWFLLISLGPYIFFFPPGWCEKTSRQIKLSASVAVEQVIGQEERPNLGASHEPSVRLR